MIQITNRKLAVGIPLSFPMVPADFFASFVRLKRPDFSFLRAENGPIAEMRNDLVREAMAINATHLIMMDVDMVYHPDTIIRLLSHDLPIVGALVYRRYPPFDPILYRGEINTYLTITDWQEGDMVEVDATGTGCLLFNMEVFEKMPDPWFEFRPNPDETRGGVVGEDIGFCSNARKAGYRIFVDTSIPADHLSTMRVNRDTYLLYKELQRAKEAHQKQTEVI